MSSEIEGGKKLKEGEARKENTCNKNLPSCNVQFTFSVFSYLEKPASSCVWFCVCRLEGNNRSFKRPVCKVHLGPTVLPCLRLAAQPNVKHLRPLGGLQTRTHVHVHTHTLSIQVWYFAECEENTVKAFQNSVLPAQPTARFRTPAKLT